MRVGGSRIANRHARAIVAALTAALLASCTATSGPGFDMAAPSYNGVGVAAVMADVAEADGSLVTANGSAGMTAPDPVTGSGEEQAALPDQVALLPAAPAASDASRNAEDAASATGAPSQDAAESSPDVPEEPVPAQLALKAPAEKRGFFASFFAQGSPPAPARSAFAPVESVPTEVAATPESSSAPAVEESAQGAQAAETIAAVAAEEEAAEPTPTTEAAAAAETEASDSAATDATDAKRGFLASLFSAQPAASPAPVQSAPARAEQAAAPLVEQEGKKDAEPLIDLSEKESPVRTASFSGDALPGVRRTSLFEITHKSGIDDNSDVDIYEDVDAPVVLASAAGLARLAPNGLLKQRESVDVACLKPSLVRILKTVERHFGKRMVVTSGYRSPSHNRRVRGAKRSQHMYCAAADVQIPGVSKWDLAAYVRSLPGRGGVGTYCHTASVHIDVGPERDWNWRCRRKS